MLGSLGYAPTDMVSNMPVRLGVCYYCRGPKPLKIKADIRKKTGNELTEVPKTKKLLGLLYRQFYKNCDSTTLLSLYVCLIRPHLEYASQVWNPHLLKDINKIENVQKFALCLCTKQWSQAMNPCSLSAIYLP